MVRCVSLAVILLVSILAQVGDARKSLLNEAVAFALPPKSASSASKVLESAPARPVQTSSRVRGVALYATGKKAAKKSTKKKAKKKGKKKVTKTKTTKAAKQVKEVQKFKKADFIASVAEKTGLTKYDSDLALQAVLDTLREQLALEKKITFLGFGSFQTRERSARTGRNPQTGEPLDIPASKSPVFTASKALKDSVNGRE